MRHNQNYNKNVRWLENVKRIEEHELLAFDIQPSTDTKRNGVQSDIKHM